MKSALFSGRIAGYDAARGAGFIQPDADLARVPFHRRKFTDAEHQPAVGQHVLFRLYMNRVGNEVVVGAREIEVE